MVQIGDKIGRLTVLNLNEEVTKQHPRIRKNGTKAGYRKYFDCQCECGNITTVSSDNLQNNSTFSCGCYLLDELKEAGKAKRGKHKELNEYDLTSFNYGIGFTKDGYEFYFDLEDYDKIKDHYWFVHKFHETYNKLCTDIWEDEKKKQITMAQFLIGSWQDHINRNPLDNRKSNLRNSTVSQNTVNTSLRSNNTSGITGVYFNNSQQAWIAYIIKEGKRYHLLQSTDKEKAIRARLLGEKEFFGEFAPQQHLFEQYGIN